MTSALDRLRTAVEAGVRRRFAAVEATASECDEVRPGDDVVSRADVTMDRAFTVPGPPQEVWPWIVQLGKRRAGWYLTRRVERVIPRRRRGLRVIEPRWQSLAVDDVIPDYGGPEASFTVAEISRPDTLVYRSQRGRVFLTWAITLRPAVVEREVTGRQPETRVLLRLRLSPVKHVWLARSAGELLDVLSIAGMAAGLRERLIDARRQEGRNA